MRKSNCQYCFEPCSQEEAEHSIAARNHTYFWARSPHGEILLLLKPELREGWKFVRPIQSEPGSAEAAKEIEAKRELADQIESDLMGEHFGSVRIDIAYPSQRGW